MTALNGIEPLTSGNLPSGHRGTRPTVFLSIAPPECSLLMYWGASPNWAYPTTFVSCLVIRSHPISGPVLLSRPKSVIGVLLGWTI